MGPTEYGAAVPSAAARTRRRTTLTAASRDIALQATGNTGPDRVNAGELAVLEDIARHHGATIGEVTTRTGLAQSLVSRIVRAAADAGALVVEPDQQDRRRVRISLSAQTRVAILDRAGNSVGDAVAAATPGLSEPERTALLDHLDAASELLRRGAGH